MILSLVACLRPAPPLPEAAPAGFAVDGGTMPQAWLAVRGVAPIRLTVYGACPGAVHVQVISRDDRVLTSIVMGVGSAMLFPPDTGDLRLRYGCDAGGEGRVAEGVTVDPWLPQEPGAGILQLPSKDADARYPLTREGAGLRLRSLPAPTVSPPPGSPPPPSQ